MNSPYNFAENMKNVFDFNQPLNSMRKSGEVATQAGQVVIEGCQAATRRLAEAARDTGDQVLKASREAFQPGSPESNLSRQAECYRSVMQTYLDTCREVTETLVKCSFEAADLVTRRMTESFEEVNKAAVNTTNAATSAASAAADRVRKTA